MTAAPLIFLVDDDANDAELARIALDSAGIAHDLEVARDGARALHALIHHGQPVPAVVPDLILLDLKLPKVNGLEVLARLRADDRMSRVPVVVFTSSTEARDLDEAYARGANAYVRKPVDFQEYRELVTAMATFWIRYNQRPVAPAVAS